MGERNPFEVFLLFAVFLQGVTVLLGIAEPTSIARSLPVSFQYVWAALLAGGGLGSLVGLGWPGDPFTAIEIKRVGFIAAGAGALVYGLATFALGPAGISVGILSTCFAAACAWRFTQVTIRIRMVRSNLAAVRTASAGDDHGRGV